MIRYVTTFLVIATLLLPGGPALALAHCESPSPTRFDSRVFGGGGATVFDLAAQYQSRRSGRSSGADSVFIGSRAPVATGTITAGDLLGGLATAVDAAATIQQRRTVQPGATNGTVQTSPSARPRSGLDSCGRPIGNYPTIC